jgi:hypothetical protein
MEPLTLFIKVSRVQITTTGNFRKKKSLQIRDEVGYQDIGILPKNLQVDDRASKPDEVNKGKKSKKQPIEPVTPIEAVDASTTVDALTEAVGASTEAIGASTDSQTNPPLT